MSYYVGFLDLLTRSPGIEVVTYAQLPWGEDVDYEARYPTEFARWQEWVSASPERAARIFVILQHDVDSAPERTMHVLEAEADRGLRSAAMIFRELIDRQRLRTEGAVVAVPYAVDHERLHVLERDNGFCVGYHCNAYERAHWDMEAASHLFRADVKELRRLHDIRVFSPHGGVPGPDGRNNNSVTPPSGLDPPVRWVANRHTLRLARSYSDGGIRDPRRDIEVRDLRDFVRGWRPGRRYRVLTHPQYYGDDARPEESLMRARWYRELFTHARSPDRIWKHVEPTSER